MQQHLSWQPWCGEALRSGRLGMWDCGRADRRHSMCWRVVLLGGEVGVCQGVQWMVLWQLPSGWGRAAA